MLLGIFSPPSPATTTHPVRSSDGRRKLEIAQRGASSWEGRKEGGPAEKQDEDRSDLSAWVRWKN